MTARSATVAAVLVLTGACGSSSGAGPPAPRVSPKLPSVINPAGTVVVTSRKDIRYTPDLNSCVTRGASADIHQGVRVEVRTSRGTPTAAGPLGPGYFRDGGSAPVGCAFDFAMTNAPGGSPSYRVTVGHRPPRVVDAADILDAVLVFP